MQPLGDTLLELVRAAQKEVVLVAPFAKASVVERIVHAVSFGVDIFCVTRWHPDEVKAGISDLEVWDVLRARGDARLLLVPTLHAKYYRADDRLAVGSANLTDSALGWSPHPNLELLILLDDTDISLKEWESSLLSRATEVDDSLTRYFRALVDKLPTPKTVRRDHCPIVDLSLPDSMFAGWNVGPWLPMSPYPERLYQTYAGRTKETTLGAKEAATHDLLVLRIPPGLDEVTFNCAVAATLLQMPLIRDVDQYLAEPRRFGAIRDLIAGRTDSTRALATRDWQVLMRWFLHFMPSRYGLSVPHYSEVMYRIG